MATGQVPQDFESRNAARNDPWASSAGKVVVLIFVRTDCPIANRYAPEIQRLSLAHASDASFWLVYPDKRETAEAIRKHQAEYHLTLPVLRDPRRELVKRAQVSVTPEAAVFDAKGRLVYHGRIDNWFEDFGRARPAPTTHELADAIAAAVSGHPVEPLSVAAVGCYLSDLQ
ncbi:MAG TPA: redoxin family protein [Candidatus Acidoferrum sp.]|nr:redoxin family protein [Candidatus Acidoferrum sp.]